MFASGAQQAQRRGTRSLFLAFSARRSARFIGGVVVSVVVVNDPYPEKAISCFLNGSPDAPFQRLDRAASPEMCRWAWAATGRPHELACPAARNVPPVRYRHRTILGDVMRNIELPGGEQVPCLGQGTWMIGDRKDRRDAEIAALRAGIDLGVTLIDTAEMYGDGASETLVGEAITGRRDEVFLVSKAYPQNASLARLPRSCEASLRRLGTDRLDLYLLHWRGNVPLAETVEAMRELQRAGKIRHWGVSNLDTDDMQELVDASGADCVTDQILYNLTRRGPEHDLLPWLDAHRMTVMAYSPVEQGRLPGNRKLEALASDLGVTAAQLALAWVLRQPGLVAIPKASTVEHVRDNRAAVDLRLDADILAQLDAAFPPPLERRPLEML
jgi:diketogulonate reductase-like aldo/keto reductase